MAGNQPALIDVLLRAYADEWFSHYNYYVAAQMVRGPEAESIGAFLRAKSASAFSRADMLAKRIAELRGRVIPKLTELFETATDKAFKLPDDPADVRGVLYAVLDAERTSINTHRLIYQLSRHDDPLTARLALELLADATDGEQRLITLLNDEAPDLDGT